jgi:hypothetical protein
MLSRRVGADLQLERDFLVRHAIGDQSQDHHLPFGWRVGLGRPSASAHLSRGLRWLVLAASIRLDGSPHGQQTSREIAGVSCQATGALDCLDQACSGCSVVTQARLVYPRFPTGIGPIFQAPGLLT